MPEQTKPCIRCGGTGVVKIEIVGPDPHVHALAGMYKCHGCGGTGEVVVEEERVLEPGCP
jgi:hypothetical protein